MQYVKIANVFSHVNRGKTPSYVETSDICVINQACIRWDEIDYSKVKYQDSTFVNPDALLKDGDILINSTGTGTLGRCNVFFAPDDRLYMADTHVTVLRGSIGMNPYIIKYFFMRRDTQQDLYSQCVNGSTNQIELSKEKLRGFRVPVPTQEEQRSIVESAQRISQIIAIRQKQLNRLDDLIKARFVEMFGDVIHNTMGWPHFVFSDIASSRLGKMLDAKQQSGKYQFPYLANFNVQWFRFALNNLNKMDFDEDDQAEYELKDGDLIVCEGGEIGRCAIWHNEIQPCYFQKALHRVRCNTGIVIPEYLARWFQFNCEHGGFAEIEGAKATIAHLPGAKLKALKVVVPPIDLQKEFAIFVTQVDKSKVVVQAALDEAQLLFDSLMQQYFG